MLDELGAVYIIENCIHQYNKNMREEIYKTYMSDIQRGIVMSLGAKGVKRYYDILNPPKEETKEVKDIVAEITAKAGLKVVSDNG